MPTVIVAGARTPFGKFGGAFKDVPAVTLGGHAIRAALERSGVAADQVDYVIMGQVLQAGAGQITARQAAIEAGIPQEVPALTINKVCLSGLNAIALADQYPDQDPRSVNFVDLYKWVLALPDFSDDPKRCGEKILEAIQMAWIDEAE